MNRTMLLLLALVALLCPAHQIHAQDVSVPAQSATKGSCTLIKPMLIGTWELTGSGPEEQVYYHHVSSQGGWAASIVVVDFAPEEEGGGCYRYPLDPGSTSSDPRTRYVIQPLQMDSEAGDELVIRPASYLDVSTVRWTGLTRVARQRTRTWFEVDFANERRNSVLYRNLIMKNLNGSLGSELAALALVSPASGSGRTYLRATTFRVHPSPKLRPDRYDVTVPDTYYDDSVVEPYKVLTGNIDDEKGDELAIVIPPDSDGTGYWQSGMVFIINDRKGTMREELLTANAPVSNYSFTMKSAAISSGKLRVVITVDDRFQGRTYDNVYEF